MNRKNKQWLAVLLLVSLLAAGCGPKIVTTAKNTSESSTAEDASEVAVDDSAADSVEPIEEEATDTSVADTTSEGSNLEEDVADETQEETPEEMPVINEESLMAIQRIALLTYEWNRWLGRDAFNYKRPLPSGRLLASEMTPEEMASFFHWYIANHFAKGDPRVKTVEMSPSNMYEIPQSEVGSLMVSMLGRTSKKGIQAVLSGETVSENKVQIYGLSGIPYDGGQFSDDPQMVVEDGRIKITGALEYYYQNESASYTLYCRPEEGGIFGGFVFDEFIFERDENSVFMPEAYAENTDFFEGVLGEFVKFARGEKYDLSAYELDNSILAEIEAERNSGNLDPTVYSFREDFDGNGYSEMVIGFATKDQPYNEEYFASGVFPFFYSFLWKLSEGRCALVDYKAAYRGSFRIREGGLLMDLSGSGGDGVYSIRIFDPFHNELIDAFEGEWSNFEEAFAAAQEMYKAYDFSDIVVTKS